MRATLKKEGSMKYFVSFCFCYICIITSNQVLINRLGIVPFSTKMRESKLRWFEHVQMKTTNVNERKVETYQLLEKKSW